MKAFFITVFLTVIIVDILAQEKVDVNKSIDAVKKCYTTDITVYNKCLLDFWNEVLPLTVNAIPELKIPKLDPITIPKIAASQTGSMVEGDSVFSDIEIKGISKAVPRKLNVDRGAKTISLELLLPEISAEGNYFIDGVVMLVPVKGNGTFLLELYGINSNAVAHLEREGATKLRLEKLNIDFEVTNMTIHLTNLYGGQDVTDSINKLINDNYQAIIVDVKPLVKTRIEEVISRFVSPMVEILPVDSFLNEEGIKQSDA